MCWPPHLLLNVLSVFVGCVARWHTVTRTLLDRPSYSILPPTILNSLTGARNKYLKSVYIGSSSSRSGGQRAIIDTGNSPYTQGIGENVGRPVSRISNRLASLHRKQLFLKKRKCSDVDVRTRWRPFGMSTLKTSDSIRKQKNIG